MRKKSLLAIFILVFGLTMSTLTIHPAEASINSRNWVGQVHPYDPYFGSSVIVFLENSSATLMVEVYNNIGAPLNVSAVKVFLDWNINYSSTQASVDTPLVIPSGFYHTFTVTFTVPSTSIASNLVKHDYYIYIEDVNATTGPKQVNVPIHASQYYQNDFVVYSTIQKDAQKLYDELGVLIGTYPTWDSDEAEMLWSNGTRERLIGLSSHQSGDFSNAKTHYETAIEMLYQALSTETNYEKTWENLDVLYRQAQIAEAQADASYREAQAKYYEAQATYQEAIANASMKQADAAIIQANASMKQAEAQFAIAEAIKTQANAWIVFGIGFIVFGFAAVVWAYRRPILSPPS